MTSCPEVLAQFPLDLVDHRVGSELQWRRAINDVLATMMISCPPDERPLFDLEPRRGRVEFSVDGRPAIVGLQQAASMNEFLDQIATRLARRPALLFGASDGRSTARDYVAGLGFIPSRADNDLRLHETLPQRIVQSAEMAIDAIRPDEVVVEVPTSRLRLFGAGDPELVPSLRNQLLRNVGVELPDIRLLPTEETNRVVRIRLNDLTFPIQSLDVNAGWRLIIARLERLTTAHAHWFLRQSDVERSLDEIGYLMPSLVAAFADCYDLGTLTAVLRELARQGENVRNLGRIAWLLLDLGRSQAGPDRLLMSEDPLLPATESRPYRRSSNHDTNPVSLASRIRKCLAEESWRVHIWTGPRHPCRLSLGTESALVSAVGLEELGTAEWNVLDEVAQYPQSDAVIVRSSKAIARVTDCLQALPHPPKVLASQELPPDANLDNVAVAEPARN